MKEITERHLAQMKKGVSEEYITRWVTEHDKARENLRQTEPVLAALEEDQVRKQLQRYSGPGVGRL